MKKIMYLLLVGLSVNLFSLDKELLVRSQFSDGNISEYLKQRIPFLDQEFEEMNHTKLQAQELFEVNFMPKSREYSFFAELTGKSITTTRFIVSWYLFNDDSMEVPVSLDDVMTVLNTKTPIDFSILTYANTQWRASTELYNLRNKTRLYVFISLPNENGVLLPLAGGSFYQDHISGMNKTVQSATLNLDVLLYWQEKGYL
ncbi:MAG: hypothetical protein ACRCTJ_04830 [Brevinema sp.]